MFVFITSLYTTFQIMEQWLLFYPINKIKSLRQIYVIGIKYYIFVLSQILRDSSTLKIELSHYENNVWCCKFSSVMQLI